MSAEDFRQDELDIPPQLKQAVREYYFDYEDFYAEPWRELDETRRRFEGADPELRMSMFTLSYLYAVLTIQAPIDAAEQHFWDIYTGREVQPVIIEGQQYTKKAEIIHRTLDYYGPEGMGEFADRLASGRVEQAVFDMEMEDMFGYIRTIKAPFIAAQLGYTSQMCVDTNVQSLFGIGGGEGGFDVSGEERDLLCTSIEGLFPDLMAEVREPYHLQWILFNFARVNDVMWEPDTGEMTLSLTGATAVEPIGGLEPEKHDRWFDAVLDDRSRVVGRVRDLFGEVRGGANGGANGGG